MKTKSRIIVAAIAALAAFGAVAQAEAQGWGGRNGGCPPCDMMGGPGGGPGPNAGPGPGFGPGDRGMGPCFQREKPLTETQVKDIVEGMIAWRGDDFTVGKVKTQDDGVIVAEVKDKDGKVVRTMAFDAKSGHPVPPAKPEK